MLRDSRAGWALKLVALAALVYVVSPIDALPEAIAPAIGWLDDVGLIFVLRLVLARKLDPYRYPLFGQPAAPAASAPPAGSGVTQS